MSRLTANQAFATQPDHSVWVTANAGAGKTTVLITRFLRLLLDGTPLRRILCLTYTNGAASEMLHRLQHYAHLWQQQPDDALRQSLSDILNTTPSARQMAVARGLFTDLVDHAGDCRIQTVHGFCQSLLKQFPVESMIAPHAQLMDDTESTALLREAWLRLLANTLPQDIDPSFHEDIRAALGMIHSALGESRLLKAIMEITIHANQLGVALPLLQLSEIQAQIADFLEIDPDNSPENLAEIWLRSIPESDFDTLRDAAKREKNHEKYHDILEWLSLEIPEKAKNFQLCESFFLTQKYEIRKTFFTKSVVSNTPGVESVCSYFVEKLLVLRDVHNRLLVYRVSSGLVFLAHLTSHIYNYLKIQHAALDFADLIRQAVFLLNRPDISPWIMYKLDGGLDHILVDEAQDTSQLQWQVIAPLCAELLTNISAQSITQRSLFVVGDEKQSIFSFQGASPRMLTEQKQHYAQLSAGQQHPFSDVILSESFRSLPVILQCVDAVFADDALRAAIATESRVKHIPIRSNHPGYIELWPLIAPPQKTKKSKPDSWLQDDITTEKTEDICAVLLAERIQQLLHTGYILPSKNRAVEAGDIMVLVPRRTDIVNALTAACRVCNIPVSGADRLECYQHPLTLQLLNALQWMNNPQDDLALVSLLTSPMFQFTDDMVFQLRQHAEKNWWAKLRESSEYARITHVLSDALAKVDYLSPYAFVLYLMESLGWRQAMVAAYDDEATDVLAALLQTIQNYSAQAGASLQGLLHMLEDQERSLKREFEQGINAVRIMTVHASKGLQAPIVILPETGSRRNNPTDAVLHTRHGNDYVPLWRIRQEYRPALCEQEAVRKEALEAQEKLRLLYVALTRAEDMLLIAGYGDAKEDSWYRIIERTLTPEANSRSLPMNNSAVEIKTWGALDWPQTEVKSTPVDIMPASSPQWLHQSAPFLPPEISGGASIKNHASLRGEVLHALLSYAPIQSLDTIIRMIPFIAAQQGWKMDDKSHADVIGRLQKLWHIPEIHALITAAGLHEISLASDNTITRPDKVILRDNQVLIIDYKSGVVAMPGSDIHQKYRQQLQNYRTSLQSLYPQHTIRCVLVWLDAATVEEVL